MTVPSEVAFWGPFAGDDLTVNFSFTGRIFDATDLIVKMTETATEIVTTLAYPANYSVTGVNNQNGGTVILATPLAIGFSLTIRRIVTLAQDSDIINQGAFHAQTHEDAWDRLAMVDQQLQQQIDDISDSGFTSETELPLSSGNGGRGTGTGQVNVLEFGAMPAATAAVNAAAIQAAIDSVASRGGGIVYFNEGIYLIDTPIEIHNHNVKLRGVGPGEVLYNSFTPTNLTGTCLKWTGGSNIMLAIGPVASSSNYNLTGVEVSDMYLNGNDLSNCCLYTSSLNLCNFKNLVMSNMTTVAMDLDVTDPLASPADYQHCTFDNIIIHARNTTFPNCIGLRLGAISTLASDVSVNWFKNFTITIHNGTAVDIYGADLNYFHGFHCFVGGTGKSLIFRGSEVGYEYTGRGNFFYAFEPSVGEVLAEGGTYPSKSNVIFGYATGNGASVPTIETGASLFYMAEQYGNLYAFNRLALSDSSINIVTEREAIANESLRIRNDGDAHIALVNAVNTWVLNVATSTGHLRIAPISGNPSVQVSDHMTIQNPGTDTYTGFLLAVNRSSVITLDQVTIGAENTGGAGKRALVVDN